MATYKLVKTKMGVTSILCEPVGEIMHNPVGPWDEANHLYISPSRLKDRLNKHDQKELVVFDVGLGAGSNAIALLHRAFGESKRISLFSFEIEIKLLKFAYDNRSHFPFMEKFEKAISAILTEGFWRQDNVSWSLFEGSFLDKIAEVSQKANLVYYDPYSPSDKDVLFFNYSQATPVRSALLAAGFYVGYGPTTGQKESTTQAARDLSLLDRPLDERWLQRWRRSDRRYPPDCQTESEFDKLIEQHLQFS